jgi:ubiquinone biosynthesis monooxygenase Coq7
MQLVALILEFDHALRVLSGVLPPARPRPGLQLPEKTSFQQGDDPARRRAAALMRVNHTGEVCAQALYRGQAAGTANEDLRKTLSSAGGEEMDHLSWTAQRIDELGGRTSLLNPLWYAGSYCLGYAAARLGDGWSLGFLAETERQVGVHLQSHIERLPADDARSQALVAAMREEELAHGAQAVALGAKPLPESVRCLMKVGAKAMTGSTYWV